MAGLLAINLLCFSNVLTGFYHADDIWHIPYAYEAAHGRPELLFRPFCGEWLDSPSFPKMYRPIVPLTEAFDSLVWGLNPLGFHLSNIVFHTAAAFMLYLVACRLFLRHGKRYAELVGVLSAVVFSVYPMHAEVVAWITERFDSLCTTLFLLSFWLFLVARQSAPSEDAPGETLSGLPSRRRAMLFLSIGAFFASLLCKEMSLTLPIVIFAYLFFFSSDGNSRTGLVRSTREALAGAMPYIAAAVVYLVIRLFAIGTAFGTYHGAAGELLQDSLWTRLFQWSNVWLPLFPVNQDLPSPLLVNSLRALYLVASLTILFRSFGKPFAPALGKTMLFCFLWLTVCLIPVIPVLSLQSDLAGARHFYMSSAPLCVLIVVVVLGCGQNAPTRCERGKPDRISLCLMALLTCSYALLTHHNNQAWEKAGTQMRSFVAAMEKRIGRLPSGKGIALVDVPLQHCGAHMVYDFESLQLLLKPPLNCADYSRQIHTPEPTFYNQTLINPERLKRLRSNPDLDLLRWNQASKSLQPVIAVAPAKPDELANIRIRPLSKERLPDGACLIELSCDSPELLPMVDIIECEIPSATVSGLGPGRVTFLWATESDKTYAPERGLSVEIAPDRSTRKYQIHLSRHRQWALARNIPHLRLLVDGNTNLESINLHCLSTDACVPKLTVIPDSGVIRTVELPCGIFKNASQVYCLSYDASRLKGAAGAVVEISNPAGRLDLFHLARENQKSKHAMKSWSQTGDKGTVVIDRSHVPVPDVYQVRVAAIDKDGAITGYFCEPLFLWMGGGFPASVRGRVAGRI